MALVCPLLAQLEQVNLDWISGGRWHNPPRKVITILSTYCQLRLISGHVVTAECLAPVGAACPDLSLGFAEASVILE